VDFWQLTGEALDYATAALELDMAADTREQLLGRFLELAPFADAAPLLDRLGAGGVPLAVLSNGTPDMLEAAFGHCGLRQHFAALISVDAVRAYKTAADAYRLAIDAFGGAPSDYVLVSSNGWDVAGAGHFGFRTFWVNRSGAPIERLGLAPTGIGRSLAELPDWLGREANE
jgi:2-haloacid dehalogenase